MTFVSTFSRVGMGREGAYGTKNSNIGSGGSGGGSLRYLGITNQALDLPDPEIEVRTYNSFGVGRSAHAAIRQGKIELRGSLPFLPVSGEVFWYAFGGSDGVSGVGPYTHTLTPSTTDVPPSFTFGVGLERASNNFLRSFVGCAVDGMTVSCTEAGELQTTFDFIAKDVEDEQTANSTLFTQPTLSGATPYMFYDRNTTVTVMGRAMARVKSFNMSIRNNLKPHWTFQSSGAQKIALLTYGYPNFECSMNIVPVGHLSGADDIYDLIESTTTATCEIAFRKSATDTITFTMGNCLIKSAAHDLPDDGNAIEVPVTVQPTSFTVTVVNNNSSNFNAQ